VAVMVTETLKVPFTVALLCYEKGGVGAACSQMHKDIVLQPMDTLKISIPALLYTVQNNALFVAVENLEAAVFQCTYQLKTLTTAILVVVFLGRSVKPHQWFALMLLMAGTIMVQEPPGAPKVQDDADVIGAADDKAVKLYLGIGATVVACLCSSFASVYLEKILTESKPSIWVRTTLPLARTSTHLPPTTYHLPPTTYHLPPTTTYHLPPTTYHLRPPNTHHLTLSRCATRSCASSRSRSPSRAPSWSRTSTSRRTAPCSTASLRSSGWPSSPTPRAA
jgi:uncharacterized membrane protein